MIDKIAHGAHEKKATQDKKKNSDRQTGHSQSNWQGRPLNMTTKRPARSKMKVVPRKKKRKKTNGSRLWRFSWAPRKKGATRPGATRSLAGVPVDFPGPGGSRRQNMFSEGPPPRGKSEPSELFRRQGGGGGGGGAPGSATYHFMFGPDWVEGWPRALGLVRERLYGLERLSIPLATGLDGWFLRSSREARRQTARGVF